jgi:hypothetical protein
MIKRTHIWSNASLGSEILKPTCTPFTATTTLSAKIKATSSSWSYVKTSATTASNEITSSSSNEISTSSTTTSASNEITTASSTTNKSAI